MQADLPDPQVHGTAYVGRDVELSGGVIIGHGAVLKGPLKVGENVQICAGVVIGTGGDHRSIPTDWEGLVEIGDDCVIREHAVIQRGLLGSRDTKLGRNCYIMSGAVITHGCQLEEDVTISHGVVLGGETTVMCGANMGIHSSTHQYVTVGSYSMVGMGAVVIRDARPFETHVGVPAVSIGINAKGVEKAGDTLKMLEIRRFEILSRRPYGSTTGS